MKIKEYHEPGKNGERYYLFNCPGCKMGHKFETPKWKFNMDMEKPTINPSYLTWWGGSYVDGKWIKSNKRCHSYITDGNIKFLGDCTHELKNKTVSLGIF